MPSNDPRTIAQLLRGMAMTGREDQQEFFAEAASLIESRNQYLVVIRGLSWDIPVGLFSDLTAATEFANSLDFTGKVEANLQRVSTEMRFCVDTSNEYVCNVSIVNFADGKPVDWDVVRDMNDGIGLDYRLASGPVGEPAVEADVTQTPGPDCHCAEPVCDHPAVQPVDVLSVGDTVTCKDATCTNEHFRKGETYKVESLGRYGTVKLEGVPGGWISSRFRKVM